MKLAAPALVRVRSKPRLALSGSANKGSAKFFREDSISAEGEVALTDIKDLEADQEFEMLALDG